ncbi:MAG: hypothetical protein ACYDCQ_17170 [Dehalococcoidia bacterium]
MTKLADAIRRSTRVDAPQIGFSPSPTKVRATMLLVALTGASGKASTEGADLVLVQGKGAAASSNGQSPVMRGLWMQDGNGDAAAARQQGFDFIVFGADDAPASILLEEEAGLVMAVQEELPDSLLQALQWLPLDALLVRWDGGVTVRRQLELQPLRLRPQAAAAGGRKRAEGRRTRGAARGRRGRRGRRSHRHGRRSPPENAACHDRRAAPTATSLPLRLANRLGFACHDYGDSGIGRQ